MGLRDRIAGFFSRLFKRRKTLPQPEEDELLDEFGRVKGTNKEEIGRNIAALEEREKENAGLEESIKTELHHEEEIDIGLDNLSKVKISDASKMESFDSEGRIRRDRRIDVKGKDGEFHRTSNLFMGYNREGFDLPNGEYVSVDEINLALEKALQQEEGTDKVKTIKCKSTGKVVEPEELKQIIAGVAFANVRFDIRDKDPESSRVTNQETAFIRLRNERDEFIRKGLLMLGNGKITLPNGEYVSKKDIEVALSNYLFDVKEITEEPILEIPTGEIKEKNGTEDIEMPPSLFEDDGEEVKKGSGERRSLHDGKDISEAGLDREEVITRKKHKEEERKTRKEKYIPKHAKAKVKKTGRKWKVWPILLAGVATLALGHNIKSTPQDPILKLNASYSFSELSEMDRLETEEEVIRRINSQFEIGQTIEVPDGVAVYQSSDHIREDANHRYGIYGESRLLISGPAQIEYISLVDQNGRIVQVTYDKEQDATVEDAVQRAVREQNFDYKTGHVMIHVSGLGPTGEYTRGGWANQQDLITNEQRLQQIVPGQESGYSVEGTEENFDNAITFTNSDGQEIRAVFPEDTDYASLTGKNLTTSDGKIYRVNGFDVGETEILVPDAVDIKWDFDHVKERAALAALFNLIGIAGFTAVNKKEIDATKEETKKDEEERSF